ncbi:Haloacid dehalogenase-like hydrolase domain-containing protein 1A [Echinococcus granulosus]|uniref:Haloacid dehalogenase hydrolase n=1 Tax=Echinococcus granulosus TaxID=6210 RepID=U6JH68_ECHGR|nr:Haloacid dehalogenase-like hydrolase domain-containing protein 1A [Echinococcus granulosus]EUB58122.1 Haloacid dehalogenase-like hydrolase domain-containing protein 1A [Echinococcus granulosus]CDS22701.1 haloacid dehalogenase hydrolase [Echinococcus granulosus]
MHEKVRVTHVIFDLDGLLINSEQIYTNQLSKFLSRHGKEYTYRVKRLMMGRTPMEAANIMCKEYDLPMAPSEVLEDYQKELPLEIWHTATLMPGVHRLIEYLSQNSIPMAVASGSTSQQVPHKMWNHREVWQHISHVVTAGDDPEVLRGKPAPDVFQVALKRFNDPSAREESTLVFEDAWNGVQAGLAAGMFVVWVPDAIEDPGFPTDSRLTEEEKTRIVRLNSLEEFDPSRFGLPPY